MEKDIQEGKHDWLNLLACIYQLVGSGVDSRKGWSLPLCCSQSDDERMLRSWIGTEDWRENSYPVSTVNWIKSTSIWKWEWGVCVCVCVCVCWGCDCVVCQWWGWQDKMEKTKVKKMLRKFTKFYATGDIKYNYWKKSSRRGGIP